MSRVVPTTALFLSAGLALGLLVPADAADPDPVVFDFKDESQIRQFVESPVTGDVRYSQSDQPGVGGQPGIMLSSNRGSQGQSLHYAGGRYDLTERPLTITASFLYASDGSAKDQPVRIFIGCSSGGQENLVSGRGKVGLRLFRDANPANEEHAWRFQLVNGYATRDLGEPLSLTDGFWYELHAVLAAVDDGNTVKFEFRLREAGPNGTTIQGLQRNAEGTTPALTNYDVRNAAIGILGQFAGDGAVAFDNLSIRSGK